MNPFTTIILATVLGGADKPLVEVKDFDRPIRVACVGDSITLGRGTSAGKNSYPAQLGPMLGPKWDVRNFGSGGAAVLRRSKTSYWNRAELKAALAFEPDVVIVEFGANDAVSDWPTNGGDFVADYAALLERFGKLATKPRLVVAGLLPVSERYRYTGPEEKARAEIAPLLSKIAKDNGARFVDLLTPAMLKKETLFDGIHPDAEGSLVMAKVAFRTLTGRDHGEDGKDSLLPTQFRVTSIQFRARSLLVNWDGKALKVERSVEGRQQPATSVTPSDAAWRQFWQEMDAVDLWKWNAEYIDPKTADGHNWSVGIHRGDKKVQSRGKNMGPAHYQRFEQAVLKLIGDKQP